MDDVAMMGKRMRQRRKEMELTLDEISEKVGVHKSTIHRYECGLIKEIKIPVVEAIAKALGVNYKWICGESNEKVLEIQSYPGLSESEQLLLTYFSKLSPADEEEILAKAEELADKMNDLD